MLPNRRAVIEVAGCYGYVGARTGSAALMATVAGAHEMSAAGHVTALRGTAPALRRAEPDAGRRAPHVLRPTGPLLPFAFARGATYFALATFGALHWMAMLEPTVPGRAWAAVGIGLLAMAALLGAARLHGALRWAAVAGISLAAVVLAFLAAGVARRDAAPRRTGTPWRRASSAGSARCRAPACPTAASTSGPGS